MSPRSNKSRNYQQESSSSNILFTLGLISVVVLLVVGWIMTQGGVNALTESSPDDMTKINIGPTPIPTLAPRIHIGDSGKTEQIRIEYEAKIRAIEEELEKERANYEKRIENLKEEYQTQIKDLKVKNMMLEQENKRLRGEK